jgi:hypothetical protein
MNQLLTNKKTSDNEIVLELNEVRKSFKIGNNELEIIKG